MENQVVWAVLWEIQGNGFIQGIFSTEEKALACCKELTSKWRYEALGEWEWTRPMERISIEEIKIQ